MHQILLIEDVTYHARKEFFLRKRKELFVSLPKLHRSLCYERCIGLSTNSSSGNFRSICCDAYGHDLVRMNRKAKLVAIFDWQLTLVSFNGIGLPCAHQPKSREANSDRSRFSSKIEESKDSPILIFRWFPSFEKQIGVADLSKAALCAIQEKCLIRSLILAGDLIEFKRSDLLPPHAAQLALIC